VLWHRSRMIGLARGVQLYRSPLLEESAGL
jgi:hypothetical protein